MPPDAKVIRCAIYTRKSTEEGLEQEFNSLDAQREACAAYVISQKHEGWRLLPEVYDDGGFSGGNMERPGLKRVMDEVGAARVDVIVVYKVDRLTRSLADFAKIIEVLDAAGASFVSVTQAFSTTTSMGRLTLNVLLSFAQFEREVTGERIRDKIAASKKKGMWMGGPVPLGYDVRDRHLVVNEGEARTVRHLYLRYLDLGSAPAVLEALAAEGVRTKVQIRSGGPHRGGIPFARGSLYHLLRNRVYRGEIIHKGAYYPGDHEPIVPEELWQAVQAALNRGVRRYTKRSDARHPSLLVGLLYDETGRRMTPSHATKGGKRYRYYITAKKNGGTDSTVLRLPAHDLEEIVIWKIREWLTDAGTVCASLADTVDAAMLSKSLSRAAELAASLGKAESCVATVANLVKKVQVFNDRAEISVMLQAIGSAADTAMIVTPLHSLRRGHEIRLVVDPPKVAKAAGDDRGMRLLAEAISVRQALLASGGTVAAFADRTGRCRGHTADLVRLSFTAPDIVAKVVEGADLDQFSIGTAGALANSWKRQRQNMATVAA